ncbi:MAG: heme exporter protein CcmD [Betaproteobacteria bacterium]|uniref:heme exporter protein CcmD n=1 Tax=Thiomonas sp. FB-6 TaxID=1158291 RepID=UPI000361E4A0|nr:heme exporter protein CcmD [Thiomonas sp. FB-6]MBU6440510.1 heme exporter protein CcmD [Betaproteobacteria bacterium]MBU6510831.1 heme exporter protein CcmD [Betaproteobacteria bacterium]MDE1954290.1 heme exporter protein CcmD [Betaproteobacteria bacterium]MDE2150954.1 heme exporter protein CcmD [Betaproteobacteria bacterium]MDE2478484.1 heme exporter protein CcmD [Betaproteobacteria bacterium]
MNWHSAAEFFAMGGYALYVWGSVAACALALGAELILLRQRRRAALSLLRRQCEVLDIESGERMQGARLHARLRREAA